MAQPALVAGRVDPSQVAELGVHRHGDQLEGKEDGERSGGRVGGIMKHMAKQGASYGGGWGILMWTRFPFLVSHQVGGAPHNSLP